MPNSSEFSGRPAGDDEPDTTDPLAAADETGETAGPDPAEHPDGIEKTDGIYKSDGVYESDGIYDADAPDVAAAGDGFPRLSRLNMGLLFLSIGSLCAALYISPAGHDVRDKVR